MIIKDRLNSLREIMIKNRIDAYIVPTDDYHGSEYVGEYFKAREFITGFTGSAGTAVIFLDSAYLFTDGRYFIQAEEQLKNTGINLMKMGEEGVPDIITFLYENLDINMAVGFDGRTLSLVYVNKMLEKFKDKFISIESGDDLIGEIWEDRPEMRSDKVFELELKYTGMSREEKIEKVRAEMKKEEAGTLVITSLEDIAYLLNLRGSDTLCTPVFLSYLMMSHDRICLFADKNKFSKEIIQKLKNVSCKIKPYEDFYKYATCIDESKKVWIDSKRINYSIVNNFPKGVEYIDKENPVYFMKAIKTETEAENERIAHIKDGVAVTKFIHYIKTTKDTVTELSAAEYLEKLRQEQDNYMGPSFEPIIGYKEHGAIIHYKATKESSSTFENSGMVLVDTGGHYLEGTTDVTRTIILGEVSDKEKMIYTSVLRGNLSLGGAKFLYGLRGVNLDYLARGPIWEIGMDYKHGTGHGVGYFLNVHEGPNSIRWKLSSEKVDSPVFEENMITSNEPGIYIEGELGVRLENLILCKKEEKNEYGQFMKFETLTMVPFDLDGIDIHIMTDKEINLLNDYHQEVYEKLSPYMNEEEKEWLKEATRKL